MEKKSIEVRARNPRKRRSGEEKVRLQTTVANSGEFVGELHRILRD